MSGFNSLMRWKILSYISCSVGGDKWGVIKALLIRASSIGALSVEDSSIGASSI